MTEIANILVISPPNYNHQQCFHEIAYSFSQSLPGKPQVLSDPDLLNEGTTLVFGAHLLTRFDATIDGDYILYQSEQLTANDSLFVDAKYLDLLKRFPVWDYSNQNIAYLKSHNINATYVPVGYNKSLSNLRTGKSVSLIGGGKNGSQRIDLAEWSGIYPVTTPTGEFVQDIDICFFGSVNERRTQIIDKLRAATIVEKGVERPLTVASFIGYGGFRDKLIARSKIVLNMHFYDSAIFEIFRCASLFANKKCLISETGKDTELEQPFYNAGCFTDYNSIVDRCINLLHSPDERADVAQKSYEVFKQVTQKQILEGIL